MNAEKNSQNFRIELGVNFDRKLNADLIIPYRNIPHRNIKKAPFDENSLSEFVRQRDCLSMSSLESFGGFFIRINEWILKLKFYVIRFTNTRLPVFYFDFWESENSLCGVLKMTEWMSGIFHEQVATFAKGRADSCCGVSKAKEKMKLAWVRSFECEKSARMFEEKHEQIKSYETWETSPDFLTFIDGR